MINNEIKKAIKEKIKKYNIYIEEADIKRDKIFLKGIKRGLNEALKQIQLTEKDKSWLKACKSEKGLKFEKLLIDLYNK